MACVPDPEPVPFPEPPWLVGESEPFVESLLDGLSDEARRLYRVYLADEVRAMTPTVRSRSWRAFDRALVEVLRRRREEREA